MKRNVRALSFELLKQHSKISPKVGLAVLHLVRNSLVALLEELCARIFFWGLWISEVSDKSETGRAKYFSVLAESSHFFPFKKVLYRRGQNVTFFGKDVTKNVTSSKKKFRVRECQGRSKPELENLRLEPRTQDLARFWNSVLFQAEPRKMMWQCDEIVTFVPSSRKIVTFLQVLKKHFRNLVASHRLGTWNVTKCDENVTSHHFVTVPHSNPGPGSGKIPAWNDPHILPRNVTNVTRHIFCHRKMWQIWRHSLESETGTWEDTRLRPTLWYIL